MLTVEQGKFGREKRRPVRKPKKIIENFLIGTTSGYDVIAADKTSRNEMNQIPHQITVTTSIWYNYSELRFTILRNHKYYFVHNSE